MTSLGALAPWLADALVILGIAVMTLGVYGIIWMPDVYNKLHAASKVVFLGVISLLVATAATGDPAFIYRLVVIGAFLLLTTPQGAEDGGPRRRGRVRTRPLRARPRRRLRERYTAWRCC